MLVYGEDYDEPGREAKKSPAAGMNRKTAEEEAALEQAAAAIDYAVSALLKLHALLPCMVAVH